MYLSDFFFIHETAIWKQMPRRFTKIELSVLHQVSAITIILNKINKLRQVSLSELYSYTRKGNAQHLIVQYLKPSTDKQTEIAKGFFIYNNAVYFYRIYKMVGNDFVKTELTKVPLGQRPWMEPLQSVNGLIDAMSFLVRGGEALLLPHYLHAGSYKTIEAFKNKFL